MHNQLSMYLFQNVVNFVDFMQPVLQVKLDA